MAFGVVTEEVVDPFLFHQARDEREVAFLILHAIRARNAGPREARILDVGDARGFGDLLDYLDHGQILEDRHVAVLRQKIRPGLQRQPIMMSARALAVISGRRYQPVETTHDLVVLQHCQRGRLAKMRLQVDLERRDDIRRNRERSTERLDAVDALEHDLFVAHVYRHLG
jgi:hypothetical protein